MKKKDILTIKDKSVKELQKEVLDLQNEIAKLKLENKINVPKDTNMLVKRKKRIAVLLTVINEKNK